MFELLLLIYLLPLIAIVALLLKLAIGLVRAVFRLALWLVSFLRKWKTGSEFVQPEFVFLGERAATIKAVPTQ